MARPLSVSCHARRITIVKREKNSFQIAAQKLPKERVADLAAQVVLATSSRPHGGNWSATAESEDKDATTNQTVAGGRDIAVV